MKDCPFCGSAEMDHSNTGVEYFHVEATDIYGATYMCGNCGCRLNPSFDADLEIAVKKCRLIWNTRVGS